MDYKKIIIHCTATKEGKDFGAKDIDEWHRARGFYCIGYHFVVRLDGTIEIGRNIAMMGAHCYGENQTSIGIAYVGGLDCFGNPCDTRTDEQKKALRDLCVSLINRYGKHITVHGHNEYSNKACPCFDVQEEFKDINDKAEKIKL